MVGTESVAAESHRMWSDVWSLHAVIGDFIWTAVDYLGDSYSGSSDGDVDWLVGARTCVRTRGLRIMLAYSFLLLVLWPQF